MPAESAERDGVRSWDLVLDARRRRGVRMTLILDPELALLAWVHYAPPLLDSQRKVFRQLLRWNDELPLIKFSLAEQDWIALSTEVPVDLLGRDALGLTVARLLAVCDLLYADSAAWVDRLGKPTTDAGPAGVRLLNRYAPHLADLTGEV